MPAEQHPSEFVEELDAFDPKWKLHYKTPLDAAKAAGNVPLYHRWLAHGDGALRAAVLAGVPDTVEANEARRKVYTKLWRMAGLWAGSTEGNDPHEDPDNVV